MASFEFFVQLIDLGSKNPLQLVHSGYQDTKSFGTKVWGGSLDFNSNMEKGRLVIWSQFDSGKGLRL